MGFNLSETFAGFRELVWPLPENILPGHLAEELSRHDNLAIVEIAGRDSIAAPLLFYEQHPDIEALLPTVGFTGTEFGDWGVVKRNCNYLRDKLRAIAPTVKVYDPIPLGAPRFWRALAGRPAGVYTKRYGIYSPCVGCHLYLHSIRIPLAVALGARWIIGGERESHDGKAKINQVAAALDGFDRFVAGFGIELAQPLREIASGEEIAEMVGSDWEDVGKQVECVLSGNYRDAGDGMVYGDEEADKFVSGYLDNYAIPLAEKVVRNFIDGVSPDYKAIAEPLIKAAK